MNLAGNQAKQLFKSLRTGASPSTVGLWAAATAVDQLRKRSSRPDKELIVSKKLKPGESYVIRMPGAEEGSLAESLAPGTRIAEIETTDEGSIASQLFTAATELIGAAAEPDEAVSLSRRQRRQASRAVVEDDAPAAEDPPKLSRRQRRKASRVVVEDDAPAAEDAPTLSRRQQRKASRAAIEEEAAPKLSRRQRRKASAVEAEEDTSSAPSNGLASTLVDVAASFMGSDEEATVEVPIAKTGRRQRRRSDRLASLEEVEFDRDALPRRRRRKLNRAERRARKRPSRRRTRRAKKRQKSAAKTYAKIERQSQPSRRRRRKLKGAERELDYRRTKVEKRSTRRRRRKLKKAEKAYEKLT